MRAYDVAMFIHLLGMIAFFIGFGLLQRVGARARQAETVEHLRMWLGLMQTTRSMFPSAVVMLLITGLYMTADAWTFGTSWVVVALVAVAVMSVMGIGVVPRFRRINAAAETAPDGPTSSELRKLVADPVAWASVSAPNGAAMGVVWLMATKPGWTASITVVLVAALAGWFLGLAAGRRAQQAPSERRST